MQVRPPQPNEAGLVNTPSRTSPPRRAPRLTKHMQRDKAAIIIAELEKGKSLGSAARTAGISYQAVQQWIEKDHEFACEYARAREAG